MQQQSAPFFERKKEVFGEIPETPGGPVTVQALMLSDWLEFSALAREQKHQQIAECLGRCVIDRNDNIVRSVEQWNIYGGVYREVVLNLYAAIDRISSPPEKKESPPS